MSVRKVPFAPNEYYHLYNRGNSKQKIFLHDKDYKHFSELLYLCNSQKNFVLRDITENKFDFDRIDTLVHIGAFCLMPNHFHILVKEKEEGGISRFMQKLSTAYVMHVNARHKRTGSLFEGKFKAQHLDSDRYLKYIFSYIHLNPIKLIQKDWKGGGILHGPKVKEYLMKYRYSSYSEYAGIDRVQAKILSREVFPNYFPTKSSFEKEIGEWVQFKLTP
jgi:putative transposase